MSVTEPEMGLRERKRRATKTAIQQAALRIAIDEGLGAVTVDEISRRADVSPRTFFNYFTSKDQALLGEDPTLPTDQSVDDFVAGLPTGDLMSDVGELLAHSTQELVEDRELMPERQQVLKENPQLFGQRMASMKEFQAQLASVIIRRLAQDVPDRPDRAPGETGTADAPSGNAPTADTPTGDAPTGDAPTADTPIARRARLASLVAMATIRHAWWEWSTLEGDDVRLADCLRASFHDLGALVSRAPA